MADLEDVSPLTHSGRLDRFDVELPARVLRIRDLRGERGLRTQHHRRRSRCHDHCTTHHDATSFISGGTLSLASLLCAAMSRRPRLMRQRCQAGCSRARRIPNRRSVITWLAGEPQTRPNLARGTCAPPDGVPPIVPTGGEGYPGVGFREDAWLKWTGSEPWSWSSRSTGAIARSPPSPSRRTPRSARNLGQGRGALPGAPQAERRRDPPAAAMPASTVGLIQADPGRRPNRGPDAWRLVAESLFAPDRLPDRYRGAPILDGTIPLLDLRRALPRSPPGPIGGRSSAFWPRPADPSPAPPTGPPCPMSIRQRTS